MGEPVLFRDLNSSQVGPSPSLLSHIRYFKYKTASQMSVALCVIGFTFYFDRDPLMA